MNQERIYRIGLGYKIFMCFMMCLYIFILITVIFYPNHHANEYDINNIYFKLIGFIMFMFVLYKLFSLFKSKLIISNEGIKVFYVFTTKTIMYYDVLGYKIKKGRGGGFILIDKNNIDDEIFITYDFKYFYKIENYIKKHFKLISE